MWGTVYNLPYDHHSESVAQILDRNKAVFSGGLSRPRHCRVGCWRGACRTAGINSCKALLLAFHLSVRQFSIHDGDSGFALVGAPDHGRFIGNCYGITAVGTKQSTALSCEKDQGKSRCVEGGEIGTPVAIGQFVYQITLFLALLSTPCRWGLKVRLLFGVTPKKTGPQWNLSLKPFQIRLWLKLRPHAIPAVFLLQL